MTGHGNVVFSTSELERMKLYLDAGGFLHIDDNYGMDPFIRPILQGLYIDSPLEKIDIGSPLFNYPFKMEEGLPKVHAHDEQVPEAYVIRRNGKIVLFYSFESDLGDGWEDQEVHNDPEKVRTQALRMGANLIAYAFSLRNDSSQ
jgi:hypothetical protein